MTAWALPTGGTHMITFAAGLKRWNGTETGRSGAVPAVAGRAARCLVLLLLRCSRPAPTYTSPVRRSALCWSTVLLRSASG